MMFDEWGFVKSWRPLVSDNEKDMIDVTSPLSFESAYCVVVYSTILDETSDVIFNCLSLELAIDLKNHLNNTVYRNGNRHCNVYDRRHSEIHREREIDGSFRTVTYFHKPIAC